MWCAHLLWNPLAVGSNLSLMLPATASPFLYGRWVSRKLLFQTGLNTLHNSIGQRGSSLLCTYTATQCGGHTFIYFTYTTRQLKTFLRTISSGTTAEPASQLARSCVQTHTHTYTLNVTPAKALSSINFRVGGKGKTTIYYFPLSYSSFPNPSCPRGQDAHTYT